MCVNVWGGGEGEGERERERREKTWEISWSDSMNPLHSLGGQWGKEEQSLTMHMHENATVKFMTPYVT